VSIAIPKNMSLYLFKVGRGQTVEENMPRRIRKRNQLCPAQDRNSALYILLHFIYAMLYLFQAVTGKRAAIRAKTA
jgi:hypothetical protein